MKDKNNTVVGVEQFTWVCNTDIDTGTGWGETPEQALFRVTGGTIGWSQVEQRFVEELDHALSHKYAAEQNVFELVLQAPLLNTTVYFTGTRR